MCEGEQSFGAEHIFGNSLLSCKLFILIQVGDVEIAGFLDTSTGVQDGTHQLLRLDVAGSFFSLPENETVSALVFDFLVNNTRFDYAAYRSLCNPSYCDIAKKKSVLYRTVELMTTLGGVWTTLVGIAALLWSLIATALSLKGSGPFYMWDK